MDITGRLLRYLDVKQHLWNANFFELVGDLTECGPLDVFESIDSLLFKGLVTQPLGMTLPLSFVRGNDAVSWIGIRPRSIFSDIEVIIGNKAPNGNFVWELPTRFASSSFEMTFVDFFQWNSYDLLTMSQVRGQASGAGPISSGTPVIVDIRSVEFFLRSASSATASTTW
jgi:hypothetical protein